MNQIYLEGNAGKDVEMKQINGKSLAKTSIAVNEGKAEQKQTVWFNLAGWDWTADSMSKIKKGDKLIVRGKMTFRDYKDKDGHEKTAHEVLCYSVGVIPKVAKATISEDDIAAIQF